MPENNPYSVNVNPYSVDLSVILENARLKYPQYKNTDDAKLTKALLAKYPQYRNSLNSHSRAMADVMSGKHDPLGILDPATSIKAFRSKYPDVNESDQTLLNWLGGSYNLRDRLAEDPSSVISKQHRPFTTAEISDMPKFLQPVARMSGLGMDKQEEKNPGTVAQVRGVGTDIDVDIPAYFNRGVMAHELLHAYQNTRNRDFKSPESDYQHEDKTYDYGGMPGLKDALSQRKTIADFSQEQQAKMIQHYYDAHRDMVNSGGKVSAETATDFEEMKQLYGPFIRQMAGVPMEDEMSQPIKPKTTPDAPSYKTSGFITGDPNIMDFQISVSK